MPFVFPGAEPTDGTAEPGRVRERNGWPEAGLDEGLDAGRPKIETVPLPLAQLPVRDRIDAWTAHRRTKAIRLIDAPRPVAFWHLASLDAPTVAVVWSLAFAWAGGIAVSSRVLLVLALTAWCAYVCDRLLDARVLDARGGLESPTQATRLGLRERHFFHWRHRRLLAPLAVAGACVAGVMAVALLPAVVRERGLILGAAAMIYFSGVHVAPRVERARRLLPKLLSKELLVAVLFTAGCILPAWSRIHAFGAQDFSSLWFWIPAVFFAALAWLNCRSIAKWESGLEGSEGRFDLEGGTMFEGTKERTSLFAALLVAFAGMLLAVVAGRAHLRPAELLTAGAASALLLALLDRVRMRMTPLALRAAADLVLLTPLALLLR